MLDKKKLYNIVYILGQSDSEKKEILGNIFVISVKLQ